MESRMHVPEWIPLYRAIFQSVSVVTRYSRILKSLHDVEGPRGVSFLPHTLPLKFRSYFVILGSNAIQLNTSIPHIFPFFISSASYKTPLYYHKRIINPEAVSSHPSKLFFRVMSTRIALYSMVKLTGVQKDWDLTGQVLVFNSSMCRSVETNFIPTQELKTLKNETTHGTTCKQDSPFHP